MGKSGRTLEKRVALVEVAEAEPEKYAKLVADMDRTGRRSMPDPDIDALEVEGRTGRLDFRSQIMKPVLAKPR